MEERRRAQQCATRLVGEDREEQVLRAHLLLAELGRLLKRAAERALRS
jgi:hypothetical protein